MCMFVETQYFNCFEPPNELLLDSALKLGPITLAYETYGSLNQNKDNVILVCHTLSGDAHAAFYQKEDKTYLGWWDILIGPGKPLDTDKYFIICINTLGSCKGSTGPSSINPKTNTKFGLSFPVITIGDMVNAQKALIDHLDINKIKMVIGGSMGGMQALEWAIMFPDYIESCVPVASTACVSPQALAFDAVGRNSIIADSNWNNGNYYEKSQPEKGLATARMIGHITYLSDELLNTKFGRKLQEKTDYAYDFSTDFQIESYLKYQGDKFVNRFDANSYLYLTKAISYFDLSKKYTSLENAFKKCSAKFLIISISSDWLYTPKQSKDMVKALIKLNKEVTYCEIDSKFGHDAFLLKNKNMEDLIYHFLENL
jgi:homoserine O-acetyltransferase/O-succinyltransferase